MNVGLTVGPDVAITNDQAASLVADATRLLHRVRPAVELSIRLCSDSDIRALNQTYRGKDSPTDVLSFPQGGDVLGDVVISVDTAARQAVERGHGPEVEWRILLVHGLCHLMGFDHQLADDRAEMRVEEQRLLAIVFVGAVPVGLVAAAEAP